MTQRRHLFLGVALALCLGSLFAFVALTGPAAAQAGTRYVSTDGVDSGDCSDLNAPCRTLQYAVDESGDGDVIKVAAGDYTDVHTRPPLPGDPYPPPGGVVTQVVYISHSLTILGGYVPPDFDPPGQEDPPSILSAGDVGRVLYAVGAISLTLDRVILRDGSTGCRYYPGDCWPPVPGYGGGAYLISATATISGCAIQSSEASWEGGGLYARNASLSIGHSRVNYNEAVMGAGFYVAGGSARLFDSDVTDNYAWDGPTLYPSIGYGGGLYLTGTVASLSNSTVTGNTAAQDGGGLHIAHSRAVLEKNVIAQNTALNQHAGIQIDGNGGGALVTSSQLTLIGNMVSDNTSHWGGGLYLSQSDAVLVGNQVLNNHVEGLLPSYGNPSGGSGLYVTGAHTEFSRNAVLANTDAQICGAMCVEGTDLLADNLIVAGNQNAPSDGYPACGAIGLSGTTATLSHLTLARNAAANPAYGLDVSSGSAVTLTNTIVASHTVGVHVSGDSRAALEATVWGTGPWGNQTDWVNEGTLITGTINLWGDPAFVDPDAGDYHLGPGSAALNRGINAGVTEDIDGEPRPDWCAYDIGADELQTGNPCLRMYLPLVPKRAY